VTLSKAQVDHEKLRLIFSPSGNPLKEFLDPSLGRSKPRASLSTG